MSGSPKIIGVLTLVLAPFAIGALWLALPLGPISGLSPIGAFALVIGTCPLPGLVVIHRWNATNADRLAGAVCYVVCGVVVVAFAGIWVSCSFIGPCDP